VLLVERGSVACPIAVFCVELAIARLPSVAAEPRVNSEKIVDLPAVAAG
jgi:hypothetical protein